MDNHPDTRPATRRKTGRPPVDFYPAMLAKVGALFVVVVLLAGLTFVASQDRDDVRAAKTYSGTPDLQVAGVLEPAPVVSEFGPAFGALTLELARGDPADRGPGTALVGQSGSLAANTATADAQDPLRRLVRR
jgi:hypothetical protein